ncbi:unnamed protein product, partial [Schistosoma guineensis]
SQKYSFEGYLYYSKAGIPSLRKTSEYSRWSRGKYNSFSSVTLLNNELIMVSNSKVLSTGNIVISGYLMKSRRIELLRKVLWNLHCMKHSSESSVLNTIIITYNNLVNTTSN